MSYLEDLSWKREVDEFADLIVNNKPVINGNSQDALKVMELVFGIYSADAVWKTKFKIEDPSGVVGQAK